MSRKRAPINPRKEFDEVEWLDERMMGHSSAYERDGQVFVEVCVSGSVELDGKEYILDRVVVLEVEPCTIKKEGA
jgi:hypothetical protein